MYKTFIIFIHLLGMSARAAFQTAGAEPVDEDEEIPLSVFVNRIVIGLVENKPYLESLRHSHPSLPEAVQDAAIQLVSALNESSHVAQDEERKQHRSTSPLTVHAGDAPAAPRGPPPSLRRRSMAASTDTDENLGAQLQPVAGSTVLAYQGDALLVEGDNYDVLLLGEGQARSRRRTSACNSDGYTGLLEGP
jgi:hypothetical protein